MAVKKKNAKSGGLGTEIGLNGRYKEDFEAAMRETRLRLEAERAEKQKKLKEFEDSYNVALEDNYRKICPVLLKSMGIDIYPSFNELLSRPELLEILDKKNDFSAVFVSDNDFLKDVASFIGSDEIVKEALKEYINSLNHNKKSETEQESEVSETETESVSGMESEIGGAETEPELGISGLV